MKKKANWADKSGRNSIWLTPPQLLVPVGSYFPGGRIPLDPATLPSNPTNAERFFTERDDGLTRPWDGPVFVNPPYSRTRKSQRVPPIRLWAAKIHEEALRGQEILALLPCGARFSTAYWQDCILGAKELNALCFIRGRVKFINGRTGKIGKQNTYDSMFYGFNVSWRRFKKAFSALGVCRRVL